jgi:hypothetical protein
MLLSFNTILLLYYCLLIIFSYPITVFYSGCYTHLTPLQAIQKMQKMARKFLLGPIAMPLEHFVRAGNILKNAQSQYTQYHSNPSKGGKRLSAVINWAMVQAVVNLDEVGGKKLYAEAVDLSEANPLVTRAYAFFMLSTAEAPIKLNRERVNILLTDASIKDPTNIKFAVAYFLYQFGAIAHPKDYRALINLAVVQVFIYIYSYIYSYMIYYSYIHTFTYSYIHTFAQCILYGNLTNSEKLLRRALSIGTTIRKYANTKNPI